MGAQRPASGCPSVGEAPPHPLSGASKHQDKNENMKNRDVAQAFVAGRPAASSNYHTDGDRLFSYATVIGWTADDGSKIVSSGKWSPTTSRHQSLAIGAGARWEEN